MSILPMLAKGPGIFMNFVAVLFVLVCIVLILVILLQKGRGGGLSGAFGGGMAGSLLGSKTGDFLTWVTIVLVAVFLLLAVVLARFYRTSDTDYGTGDTTTVQSTSPAPGEGTDTAAIDGSGDETELPDVETDIVPETGAEPVSATPVVPVEPNAGG